VSPAAAKAARVVHDLRAREGPAQLRRDLVEQHERHARGALQRGDAHERLGVGQRLRRHDHQLAARLLRRQPRQPLGAELPAVDRADAVDRRVDVPPVAMKSVPKRSASPPTVMVALGSTLRRT
jgi:hypothetical protein